MRLYLEVARLTCARHATYRAATLAGMTTNVFFGLIRSFVFMAAFAPGELQGGWSESDTLAYVWLGQALITPVQIWGGWDVALSIRSGDVVTDLSRPYDYYTYWLSQDLGRTAFHVISRLVPTLLVGMLLFDVRFTTNPWQWLWFSASVLLAVWVSFGLRFLANLASFWLLDYRGVGMLLMFVTNFFSGLLVPLTFWPDTLRQVGLALPFAALIQTPIDVLLGRATHAELLFGVGMQLAWGLTLFWLCRLTVAAATRRVVVQGG